MLSVSKDVEKLGPSDAECKTVQLLQKAVWQVLTRFAVATVRPCRSTPRRTPKGSEDARASTSLYTSAHSSISSQKGKAASIPVTDEQINKMWSVHTVELPSAMKTNEAVMQATTWCTLKT